MWVLTTNNLSDLIEVKPEKSTTVESDDTLMFEKLCGTQVTQRL